MIFNSFQFLWLFPIIFFLVVIIGKRDGFGLKWEPTNPNSEVLAKIAQSIRDQMEA